MKPKKKPQMFQVELSDFGKRVQKGLAPKTKELIGKKLTMKEWEKKLYEIGTANTNLFKLK